jgi:hypothetical protein
VGTRTEGYLKPTITIGADPEFFLEQNGLLRSAIDRIGGNKHSPRPLGDRKGFFVQEDNVAVEFNIPPQTEVEGFVEAIEWSIKEISKEVACFSFKPAFLPAALFPPLELRDARAQQFGCEPDYNAWNNSLANPKPHASNERLRSCGGHVHVGYPTGAIQNVEHLIQMMDLYLGVPSIMMDEDTDRRQLYGKAGSYRAQPWGGEYRVLSCFWLRDKKYSKWVFEQTHRAVDKVLELQEQLGTEKYRKFVEAHDLGDEIQEVINHSNVNLAQKLIQHHDLSMVT